MRTTAEAFARSVAHGAVAAAGAIRRMAISATASALWTLTGMRMPDGTIETPIVEVFSGIGFFARPPSSGSPEAIVVMCGGAKSPAVVAVRDEATRAAIANALAQDESMVFNSKSVVYVKADGTIEARNSGGAAVSLATKADVVALANYVQGLLVGGSGSAVAPPGTVPQPTGTTVLKGQ